MKAAADLALPSGDQLRADSIIHQYEFAVEHDRMHANAQKITLDSAASLLRTDLGGSNTTAARWLLNNLHEPLTDAQRTRSETLQRRVSEREATVRRAQERKREEESANERRLYAGRLETAMLDQGLDLDASVSGTNNTTLIIRYILVNRVWAHQMSGNSDLTATWRGLGFKKIRITDGYDDTWSWDL